MVQVFAVPVFFIVFRETLETGIIVSVLLAFLKQQLGPDQDKQLYKKLRNQVWLGTLIGLSICIVIGAALIAVFYTIGKDKWGTTEDLWEGIFAIFASIIISIMGAALLRVSKLQAKWRVKLAKALEAKDRDIARSGKLGVRVKAWCEKYAMFILPFITILREGLEAIVFIGGVSLGLPATSIPLAAIVGLAAGCLVSYIIYRGGSSSPLQMFLIVSTGFLYLVAAGLFSRAIWYLEQNEWNKLTGGDAAETGSGPGSYDIRKSVWHVNCCNPEVNGGGGWGIFNAILGWQNSATYGSVIGYDIYWLAVILGFVAMRIKERRGAWPFMKRKVDAPAIQERSASDSESSIDEKRTVVQRPAFEVHSQSAINHTA
jgi:high-affinity iron transporter